MRVILPLTLILSPIAASVVFQGCLTAEKGGKGKVVDDEHRDLVITRFHPKDGDCRLYTLDTVADFTLEKGVPRDIRYAWKCWQLPKATVIASKNISLPAGIIATGWTQLSRLAAPADHQLPLSLLFVLSTSSPVDREGSGLVLRMDTGDVVLSIKGDKQHYDRLALVDPKTVLLLDWYDLPGRKLSYLLARWEQDKLSIQRESQLTLPMRDVLASDMRKTELRLFYHACASPKEAEALSAEPDRRKRWNLLIGPAPVRVCKLQCDTGRVIEDRLLVEKASSPVLAFTQDGEELWLYDSHQLTCYDADSLKSKRHVALDPKTALPQLPLKNRGEGQRLYEIGAYPVVDPTGRYLSFWRFGVGSDVVLVPGPVVLIDAHQGKIVMADQTHAHKLFSLAESLPPEQPIFPSSELFIADLAFIDNGRTLVAVAGTGHLYFYDVAQAKLVRTVVFSKLARTIVK